MSNQNITALQDIFIQLENEARHANTFAELVFTIANSTKQIINYHQAVVWRKSAIGRPKIESISGIGMVNQEAPFVQWLRERCARIAQGPHAKETHELNRKAFNDEILKEWDEWLPPHVLWLPLLSKDNDLLGGIWLSRETPFKDNEITILSQLGEAYAYAWQLLKLEKQPSWWEKFNRYPKRSTIYTALGIAIVILLLPLRQTVLAPAEIVAQDPVIVSSPLDGVIEDILAEPNQTVTENQPLFKLDETKFINQYNVAQKALDVANQKYRKTGQNAFDNPESKAELAVLSAEVEMRRAEMNYSKSMLDQITVRAEQAGTVIFSNKSDWIGKPVTIGEKVMMIANPNDKALDVWLPVSDAINLSPGDQVKLFLNVDPLNPIHAKIEYTSYSATERPNGSLAYLVRAQFSDEEEVPRVGLKGTAKLYGQRIVLIYHILWRPLSAMRRTLGI